MATTPGFVEQMDRLILACHSGATGSLLVMAKDLRIRNKENYVKMEPSIAEDNDTVDMSDSAATVGAESRQWSQKVKDKRDRNEVITVGLKLLDGLRYESNRIREVIVEVELNMKMLVMLHLPRYEEPLVKMFKRFKPESWEQNMMSKMVIGQSQKTKKLFH
ncbi:Alcohol dehydrogenase [Phytophthora megakarya]|uniref:Alcohol dehydrogenase n=1 Tax=Phytophthora megakarya TaxID=4795 RepID=A0A225WFS9_9STRA|nr:Alcohol dehydrogenase [Phytophthora megakarya]